MYFCVILKTECVLESTLPSATKDTNFLSRFHFHNLHFAKRIAQKIDKNSRWNSAVERNVPLIARGLNHRPIDRSIRWRKRLFQLEFATNRNGSLRAAISFSTSNDGVSNNETKCCMPRSNDARKNEHSSKHACFFFFPSRSRSCKKRSPAISRSLSRIVLDGISAHDAVTRRDFRWFVAGNNFVHRRNQISRISIISV